VTSWPIVRLDEVAEVRLGRQRSPKNHAGDDMRPYLRAANVGWGGLLLEDVKRMNFTDAEMVTYRLEPGDLLLNEASGSRHEVGKPALWLSEIDDCAFQNTLLRVRPNAAEPRFLFHYFRYMATTGGFADRSRGVGIYHLGRDALASLPVPKPSLDQQRRIADILDRVEAAGAARRRSRALLDELDDSILMSLSSAASRDFESSSIFELGELLARIESGRSPNCLDRPAARGEWGVLKLSAVTSGDYRPTQNKALPSSETPHSAFEVRAGDILMTRKNTPQLVGASAVVLQTPPRLLMPDLIFRLRLHEDAPVRPVYLQRLLSSPSKRRALTALAGGSAASMVNISKARLSRLPVEVPPMPLQCELEERFEHLNGHRNLLASQARELAQLQHSLTTRAFKGEL
jgi:type I restriction enzyme S subunit